jgi:capsular exopolysaccharide synthesis family protein
VTLIIISKNRLIGHTYPIPNLDFITAGPVPPNPSELILTKEMNEFIEDVKSKYDYVIIDNPPIGLVADAMKTILIADYPIYVMKANYSKRMFIQNVERLYHESNLRNISVVLNAVDSNLSSYASGKGRYYC